MLSTRNVSSWRTSTRAAAEPEAEDDDGAVGPPGGRELPVTNAEADASARRKVKQQSVDPRRDVLPPRDREHVLPFAEVYDRHGQALLARDERDGGVTAIVPGGARLADRPDQVDVPVLWRYAYWVNAANFNAWMPPTFVVDTTLQECVRRHADRAHWMLERGAEQLDDVTRFVLRTDVVHEQSKATASRRALFVLLELEAAVGYYTRHTGNPAPGRTAAAIEAARHVMDGPAVVGIARLSKLAGDVTVGLRPPYRPLPGLTWTGMTVRLLMVFLKLHEAQRALDPPRDPDEVLVRLRLLKGALDLASYRKSGGRALNRLERMCVRAIKQHDDDKWTTEYLERLHLSLNKEAKRLCRMLPANPRNRNERTAALLERDLDLLANGVG